jgi:hypothetical protein
MKIRLPLNGQSPRTLREAARDPWDWWEASPRPSTPPEHMAGVIIFLVIVIIGVAGTLHFVLKGVQ